MHQIPLGISKGKTLIIWSALYTLRSAAPVPQGTIYELQQTKLNSSIFSIAVIRCTTITSNSPWFAIQLIP